MEPAFIRPAKSRTCMYTIILLLSLFSMHASAVVLPTTSLTCTQAITATTTCVGNGYFAAGWVVGNGYWEYTVSTLGYRNIQFTTPTMSSSTGPRTGLVYCEDPFGVFQLLTTYSVGTTCAIKGPITLPASCNNKATVRLRIIMTGATAAGGTNRVAANNVFTGDPLINFSIAGISQLYYAAPATDVPLTNIFDLGFNYQHYFTSNQAPAYLNLYVKDNSTGNKLWAVENLGLDPSDSSRDLHYPMALWPLFDAGIPVSSLGVYYTITQAIVSSSIILPDSLFQTIAVQTGTIDFGPGGSKRDSASYSSADTLTRPNAWGGGTGVVGTPVVRKMPNIDLDSSTYRADTSYAGDFMACAPAACANSLQWLEQQLPTKINSGKTHREKLKELSKMMKRPANGGTDPVDLVKGKLAFVDKCKLPIRVSFQNCDVSDSVIQSPDTTYKHVAVNANADRKDTAKKNKLSWSWLADEMKAGADVELEYTEKKFLAGGGFAWTYTHVVTVTGISDKDGVKRLTIADDDSQRNSGGCRELIVTVQTADDGLMYIPELDKKPAKTLTHRSFLYCLYSERYDSTVKFTAPKQAMGLAQPDEKSLIVTVKPNPFREGHPLMLAFTTIPGQTLQIGITDINGRLVHAYTGTTRAQNQYTWDGHTADGAVLPGIYLVTVHAAGRTAQLKVVKE